MGKGLPCKHEDLSCSGTHVTRAPCGRGVTPVLESQRQPCWLAGLSRPMTPHIPERNPSLRTQRRQLPRKNTQSHSLASTYKQGHTHTHTHAMYAHMDAWMHAWGHTKNLKMKKAMEHTYKNLPPTFLGQRGLEAVGEPSG